MTRIGMLALVAVFALQACGGTDGGAKRTAWTTTVDSTSDTIQVRISGEVPAELIATLTPELRVGALDGAEELTFGNIGDVLPTADGGLLVHDDQATIIRFYDAQGAFVKPLGAKGGGPGEYNQVNGIARHANGDILVWDATGSRINRYRADGTFVDQFRVPLSSWFTNNRLYATRDGSVYIWSPIREHPTDPMQRIEGLIRMDTLGTVLDSAEYLSWGAGPALLSATSPDGRSRTTTVVPFQAYDVTSLMPDGGFVTGNGASYAFYILPKSGRPIRVSRDAAPVPVSETERSERRAQIEQNMKNLNPSWNWTGPEIPATKPAWTSLRVGEDGRIWVGVPNVAESIPEAERSPPPLSQNGRPPRIQLTTRELPRYDVYSPTGELLGRVALPPRVRVLRFGAEHVWGTLRDGDDVDYVVRFRTTGLGGETP